MQNFIKKNTVTIIIVIATIILAAIAIFTAIRLYQLRQQPVAPNAPSSKPAAAPAPNCQTTFNVGTGTLPPITYSCAGLQIFDSNWNPLTDYQLETGQIPAGTTVNFVISGAPISNQTDFDSARFFTGDNVNNQANPIAATPRLKGTQYYISYTILPGVNSIWGQIHNKIDNNWYDFSHASPCYLSYSLATPTPTPTVPPSCNSSCTPFGNNCPTGYTCANVSNRGAAIYECRNSSCISDNTCTCATATPTLTPTPTATTVGTTTPTPTATTYAFVTPTPTTPPSCNTSCSTASDCPIGMTCSGNVCRNISCTDSTNCICNNNNVTTTPTATTNFASGPTATTSNLAVGPTATPTLPNSGTIEPTILGLGVGAILLIAGIALIL